MVMKKKILLFISLLFITGCSANYDIEIYNDQVKEDMEFISTDSFNWDSEVQYGFSYRELVLASYEYPYPAFYNAVVDENDTIKLDGVEYYNNQLISDSSRLGQKLSYHKFNLNNFHESSILRKCYQYFNMIEQEDELVLSTSLENLCFQEYPMLDNITIHLKTNHKVVSHNADIVDGYHYTWNLTRDQKEDSAILLTIKKDEYIFNYENEFLKKVMYFVVFTGIILSVSSICYLYIKNKRNQMNEI